MAAEVLIMPWLAPGNLFLVLDCLAQPQYEGRYMVLQQRDMPFFVDSHGKPDPF